MHLLSIEIIQSHFGLSSFPLFLFFFHNFRNISTFEIEEDNFFLKIYMSLERKNVTFKGEFPHKEIFV